MKLLNHRTKFEVVGAIFMVVILLTACVLGGNRIISDSSDNSVTFITNSNGGHWTATGANIQTAIWDLNGTGGEVHLPRGYIDIDNINITDKVTVIGAGNLGNEHPSQAGVGGAGGTQINLSANTDEIRISGGRLWNVKIYCPDGYTGVAINCSPAGGNDECEGVVILRDVTLWCNEEGDATPTGTGVLLYADYGGDSQHGYHYAFCYLENVKINNFEYGLKLDANRENAWINMNYFNNILTHGCRIGLHITGNVSGNIFTNYGCQSISGGSDHSIFIETTYGGGNRFDNIKTSDWHVANDVPIKIESDHNTISGYVSVLHGLNITGVGNTLNLRPSESHVYTVYPNGRNDGTYIDDILDAIDALENATIIFMPGVYDIDATINRATAYFEFIFRKGVIFEVNSSFTDDYVIYLGDDSYIHGPGIIDGNNVSGVSGIRIFKRQHIDGLTLTGFNDEAIAIEAVSYAIVENCLFEHNYGQAIYLQNSYNVSILNNEFFNCTVNGAYTTQFATGGHIILDKNIFEKIGDYGLYTGAPLTNCTFSNNRFINTNNRGMYIFGSSHNIYSNYFIDIPDRALWLKDSDSKVRDNFFWNCGTNIDDDSTNDIILDNHGYNHNSLFPFYEQNTAPTITDNCTAYWYDTDDDYMYQITNSYDSVWYVNMTKTI